MAGYTTDRIRNVVLVSHSAAGKSSLAEAFLLNAGVIKTLGKAQGMSTAVDYMDDERERQTTINTKVISFDWNGAHVTLLDTPGYADFMGDVLTSLQAVEAAIVLIDAASGIQVGTERVWKFLENKNLPRLIFINKIDRENVDIGKLIAAITAKFGKRCVPITYPCGTGAAFKEVANLLTKENIDKVKDGNKLREILMETVAEADDALLEKYLESGTMSDEELKSGLGKGVLNGKTVPIFCGSATGNVGIRPVMEAVINILPSLVDAAASKGKNAATGAEVLVESKAERPFSAQVFKTIIDPYVGQLSVFKIFSGTLQTDTGFYNVTKGERERIGHLVQLLGKEQIPKERAIPGDIVAVAKLKNTQTGDSLGDEKNPIALDWVPLPESAISFSVKPKSKSDEDKISAGLSKLGAEDTTFKVSRDAQTKELIVSGLGNLHLDVMINRLKNRFGIDVDIGTPKIPYKETIMTKGDSQYRHKKQTGGAGQFAEVWLRVEPMERGGGFEFVDDVVGGAIPAPFIVSCEKGIKSAMEEGILAGYPVVDVRAVVYDGKTHPVDSKDIAFQIAARSGFKEAFLKARPVFLEPIMEVEIAVPEEHMGDIAGSLTARRGKIAGMEQGIVRAFIPLAEMYKYASELKSITSGRGSYTMRFSTYEQVPSHIAEEIIAKAKKEKEDKAS